MQLIHKKNEIMPLASNMHGPRDDYTNGSKSEKGKYHLISLTCGI